MRRTNLQNWVVRKAQRKLKKRPWYNGVCVDLLSTTLSTDAKIKERGIGNAIKDIYFDTAFWDATGFQGA